MPQKKKKPPANGFFYFMREVQQEESAKGNHCNMTKAKEIADARWKEMSSDERKPYMDKGRAVKVNCVGSKKFSSLGTDIEYLKSERLTKEEFNNIMKLTINAETRVDDETLIKKKIFLCHVNFYYWAQKLEQFRPAEFAMTVFNLEQGLIDSLHFFIKTDIPLGFKYDAKEWSGRTHQIPFDNSSCGDCETSYSSMYTRVFNFICKHSSSEIPPIYTMFDSPNCNFSNTAVCNMFAYMSDAAGADSSIFKVYDLSVLFMELRIRCNPVTKSSVTPTLAILRNEIEKDLFSHAKDISCKFHEKNDSSTHCSLSLTRRWAFILCDHCCKHFKISLKLGFHIPKETDVNWKQEWSGPFAQEKRNEQRLAHDTETTRAPFISYKEKIVGKVNNTTDPVPASSAQTSRREDNDGKYSEWALVSPRGSGRGRGILAPKDHENVRWPISGRGQRLK